MDLEAFNQPVLSQAGLSGQKQSELNLVSLSDTFDTLKNDFQKSEPVLREILGKTKPETMACAALAGGSLRMALCSGSPAVLGIGSAVALGFAGKVVYDVAANTLDTVLPKVQPIDNKRK